MKLRIFEDLIFTNFLCFTIHRVTKGGGVTYTFPKVRNERSLGVSNIIQTGHNAEFKYIPHLIYHLNIYLSQVWIPDPSHN